MVSIKFGKTDKIILNPHQSVPLYSTISIDIKVGFARDAYSVFESEGEISVEVVLDQPSVPSFPIPVSVEVHSHDAGEA